MAFEAAGENGSAATELRCRCACVHHGPGPARIDRIQGCGAMTAPDRELPSDRHASSPGKGKEIDVELDTASPIQGLGIQGLMVWTPPAALVWQSEGVAGHLR